jgi:hypothetical protein
MASAILTSFICRQQRLLTLTRSPGKIEIRNISFYNLKIVATQLWTRLASTSVQQQSQSQNQSSRLISKNFYYLFELNFFSLVNLQQLKNLKVDYQDGIAVVQFNQENSKVISFILKNLLYIFFI